MTDIVPWTPSEFEGSDLLPIALGSQPIDDTGREHIEASDLIVPTLNVVTGTSDSLKLPGAKLGWIHLSGADVFFEPPVRLLLCGYHKSRALFPSPNNPRHAELHICTSRDAVHGSYYGDCSLCEHKEWPKREAGRRVEPPACALAHCFIAITEHGPALLRMAKSSFPGGKKLVSAWQMSPYPLWQYPTILSIEKGQQDINGKKQDYFIKHLMWDRKNPVPDHVKELAIKIHTQMMAYHEAGRLSSAEESGDPFDRAEG